MQHTKSRYVPALGFLTRPRLYDPIVGVTVRTQLTTKFWYPGLLQRKQTGGESICDWKTR